MSIASVCSRKARHHSEKCARKALAATEALGPPCLPVSKLVVYKCPHCEFWHVGHEIPAGARAKPPKKIMILKGAS